MEHAKRSRRLEGLENFNIFQPYEVIGRYDIPVIAPVTELGTLKWRGFGEIRSGSGATFDTGVHFFLDD